MVRRQVIRGVSGLMGTNSRSFVVISDKDSVNQYGAPNADASSRFHRLVEPPALFAAMGVLILVVIWATTFNLAARERASAERTARALVSDLANTYEAQVLRALREIDSTLKLVRYSLDTNVPADAIEELRSEELLPFEVIFTVTITDAQGAVVASTDPFDADNVAGSGYFQRARENDGMVISEPWFDDELNEWQLSFSRRRENAEGHFSGIVAVSLQANYFVSGYEADTIGENGMLGLVGTDGVFRIGRSGDDVFAAEEADYDTLVSEGATDGSPTRLMVNPWDGVHRYTLARELYEFPLAIVVGVSKAEHLAPVAALERTYIKRAIAASVLVVAVIVLLIWLSLQLQRARIRVMNERVERARQVEYLAFHDDLTDLPNRAFFSRLLVQEIQQSRRYGRQLSLLFLDLDGFKAINDSLGHDAGDELLQEVSQRLTQVLRESDVVARLGGDEFVVLIPQVNECAKIDVVADKVLATVCKPFTIAGHEFRISASVGIALFPEDGNDEQTLMKNADLAMYHAKEKGKNNYQFYSEKLNTDSLERLALDSSLRRALQNNEFRLFYQAKRDMTTGEIVGMEALLRWEHPELGLTGPMQFIPQAEESGFIVPIGRWVLETACRQNVAWQKEGFPPLSMAVNLSARQFVDKNLLEDIKSALDVSGMAPELLEVEITESMIMPNMERSLDILNRLKAMGVRIAIDDFGTGYSSLSSLNEFPLDTIKIDRSFIRDLHLGEEGQNLTNAVITVGKNLSLTVIAEGVESWEQADFLRTHMCDQFQGFYISEPVPAKEFAEQFGAQLEKWRKSGPSE